MNIKKLGNFVKKERMKLKLSMRVFGSRCGTSAMTIQRLEAGISFPKPAVLDAIAAELKINLADFDQVMMDERSNQKLCWSDLVHWRYVVRDDPEAFDEVGVINEEDMIRLTKAISNFPGGVQPLTFLTLLAELLRAKG